MKCTLTFKIGDVLVAIEHDGSLQPDFSEEDFLKLLKNSKEWSTVVKTIEDLIKNKVGFYQDLKLSELQKDNTLVPNCNLAFIQEQNPDIEFPQGMNPNILLKNNLRLGTTNSFGRVIKADGSEMFILKNDKTQFYKLANFLNLRNTIKLELLKVDEDSNEYKILNKIKNHFKDLKNIEDLIEDFSCNVDKYADLYIDLDGKKLFAYSFLQDFVANILEKVPRKKYDNELVNDVSKVLKYGTHNKNFGANLKITTLYKILSERGKDFLEALNITKQNEFTNLFKLEEDTLKKLLSESKLLQESDFDGFKLPMSALLYKILNKQEPSFVLYAYSYDSKKIYFKSEPRTIYNKYDVGYDTIKLMEIENDDYKGFKIYKQIDKENVYFYPSKYFLQKDSITTRFSTVEEAITYIDNYILNLDLYSNSLLDFNVNKTEENTVKSVTWIPEKTMISIPDIKIEGKFNSAISSEVALMKLGAKQKDLIKAINELPIKSGLKNLILLKLTDPKRAIAFFYKLNLVEDRDNPEVINKLLNEVTSAKNKYYYIVKRKQISAAKNKGYKNVYEYTFVETSEKDIEEYLKNNERIPIIRLMQSISNSFKDRFGVEVNLINNDEMKEKFPKYAADAKAFIVNDSIYINTDLADSSDLLHEYTHLLLGVLKANPDLVERYELMLDIVAYNPDNQKLLETVKEKYPELSEINQKEEVFAIRFSNYLLGKGSEFDLIFKENQKILKQSSLSIFDASESEDLRILYNNPISLFLRFNSDVARALSSDNGLNFSNGNLTRKKAKWLDELIKNNIIKEQCNGL